MKPYLLHHLLEDSARRAEHSTAVVDGRRSMTWGDLERRANRLAHLLSAVGVGRGDRVGLYLDKSIEAVVGLYGALKAGAAYVPLDPAAPTTRLGYIARDCGIGCLLTSTGKAGSLGGLVDAGAPLHAGVVLDAGAGGVPTPPGVTLLDATALDAQPDFAPTVATISLDPAYVLYTSGSTGSPKGVVLSHLNALAFIGWSVEEFAVGPDDRLSSHAPFHFDLSVFDLFAAAHAGAAVVLVPRSTTVFPAEVRRFIADTHISVWYSVPSALTMLLLHGGVCAGDFPHLRTMLFAGEVFPTKHLRQLMELLPHARFVNLYGPTETNVCTWYDVTAPPKEDTETIPIGRAIDDVDVFAVSADARRSVPGEVGELYVRGATVMQGYWGDAERTEQALVAFPGGAGPRDLAYRTGDLVQDLGDGNYRFLGRRDTQVKRRGYRIELGEIEAVLHAHPGVEESAVVAVADDEATARIAAYVVGRDGIDEGQLVEFCLQRLPRSMLPDAFELRGSLPKTSTGKTDRQALTRLAARP